jgi:hypothetical protein
MNDAWQALAPHRPSSPSRGGHFAENEKMGDIGG